MRSVQVPPLRNRPMIEELLTAATPRRVSGIPVSSTNRATSASNSSSSVRGAQGVAISGTAIRMLGISAPPLEFRSVSGMCNRAFGTVISVIFGSLANLGMACQAPFFKRNAVDTAGPFKKFSLTAGFFLRNLRPQRQRRTDMKEDPNPLAPTLIRWNLEVEVGLAALPRTPE